MHIKHPALNLQHVLAPSSSDSSFATSWAKGTDSQCYHWDGSSMAPLGSADLCDLGASGLDHGRGMAGRSRASRWTEPQAKARPRHAVGVPSQSGVADPSWQRLGDRIILQAMRPPLDVPVPPEPVHDHSGAQPVERWTGEGKGSSGSSGTGFTRGSSRT